MLTRGTEQNGTNYFGIAGTNTPLTGMYNSTCICEGLSTQYTLYMYSVYNMIGTALSQSTHSRKPLRASTGMHNAPEGTVTIVHMYTCTSCMFC